ncbi:hypothetical protein [Flavobacterium hungaricum]|uniref:Uncharacterized protein n=1 Tax=Flavobacterium hungaricum TaxID=2082725 RepID=A0ABR9TKX2_9FLAO|nr:hypothetical protein [Flavobacterium hungaricum]MBE8726015.1 hypothetical protein [Flavobacterium hungaricum]
MFTSKKTSIDQSKEKTFIYEFDKHIDTIRFTNSNLYFNSKLLKIIDQKKISSKGESITVYKCLYHDTKDYRSDKHLYLDRKGGLLFLENLFTGEMYEFDTNEYGSIHKKIALKKFSFQDGPFELQYGKRDYIEINPN